MYKEKKLKERELAKAYKAKGGEEFEDLLNNSAEDEDDKKHTHDNDQKLLEEKEK